MQTRGAVDEISDYDVDRNHDGEHHCGIELPVEVLDVVRLGLVAVADPSKEQRNQDDEQQSDDLAASQMQILHRCPPLRTSQLYTKF